MPESETNSDAGRRLTQEVMTDSIPLAGTLGLELLSALSERVEGRLAYSPDRCTAGGVLHGGSLMALADTFGGVCAYLNLPPGAATATIETKTNFFRAVREGHVDSVSRPLHVGRSTIAVQTDLFDANGRHVAQTTRPRRWSAVQEGEDLMTTAHQPRQPVCGQSRRRCGRLRSGPPLFRLRHQAVTASATVRLSS